MREKRARWIPARQILEHRPVQLATAFSGIGAIEHALERMGIGYDIVFASDSDKFVKESYFANYPIDPDNWYDDVRDIDGTKFRYKVDLLVGGSPCQSFSTVGARSGMDDFRGTLIYEFVRLIKESKPRVFIFENVRGLLTHNSGNTWKQVISSFQNLGYSVHHDAMNAKDFGLPQHRVRLFVVGFRNKRDDFEFPKPIPLALTMKNMLEDTPNKSKFVPNRGARFVSHTGSRSRNVGGKKESSSHRVTRPGDFEISPPCKVDEKYTLSTKVRKYVLATGTKNFRCKVETDLDIARPILSSVHKMHRAGVDNYITGSGGKLRKLTPRECMRLMGFDDSYRIVVSDVQTYRQSGNSMAVNVLMELIGGIGLDWLKK